ncbi:hypothetical protein [Rhizobium sp. RU36D]|uniref:hypothetical protein n=1 Tax=Rhizobium sp. RU36D TaxID=1907415 RepID=UPI0009D87632|nr:hypothetical protein [Rhizobium sp. RU36D]SMD18610.1 hypothetical protein SAMN05880593_13548 [Rhizobium sp. RU36D]
MNQFTPFAHPRTIILVDTPLFSPRARIVALMLAMISLASAGVMAGQALADLERTYATEARI